MKHEDLPERWKQKVVEWLKSQGEISRTELHAEDFHANAVVKIKFEDDSYAEFFYPIVIEAAELNEVAVFTEHCGYHIFNMTGTHVYFEPLLD
jgi:hypothetical protein